MKKMWLVLIIAAGTVMVAPLAHAICPVPTPITDTASAEGLSAACPDGAKVAAFIYAATAPGTVNSGTANVVCEAVGGDCLTGGVVGDNAVNLEGDWGNPGYVGCITDRPDRRMIAVVQAADGSGFLATASGNDIGFGVNFIVAHKIDTATFEVFPFACGNSAGRPTVLSSSAAGGIATLNLQFDRPVIASDCDADSYGVALAGFGFPNSCEVPFDATPMVNGVYTRAQACGTRPSIDRSQWTRSTATPDAIGRASLTVPLPLQQPLPAPPQCLFVGSTLTVANNESGAITGYVEVAGDLAASPQALSVRAAQAGGKIIANFDTNTEVGLGKINILTTDSKGSRQVASLAPKGFGGAGASYEVSIARSDLKGGKTIEVELISVTGQRLFKSAPVGF